MIILLLLLPACKTQKHMETNTDIEQKVEMVETTDKNTIKYITVYEYETIYDTIKKEYPVKKKTEIKEVNNDKITTETKAETDIEEKTVEDEKKESEFKWYVICFCVGFGLAILIVVALKVLKWYIRRGV